MELSQVLWQVVSVELEGKSFLKMAVHESVLSKILPPQNSFYWKLLQHLR